jgi:hypothetical protein
MTEWEIIVEDGDLIVEFEKSGKKKKRKRRRGLVFRGAGNRRKPGKLKIN